MSEYAEIKKLIDNLDIAWENAGYKDKVFSIDADNKPLRISTIRYLIDIIEKLKKSDVAIGEHVRLVPLTYQNAEHIGFILDELERAKALTE